MPLPHFICDQPTIHLHGKSRRPHITGPMHGEFVAEAWVPLSKVIGRFQKSLFFFRRSDLGDGSVESSDALQQLAMVPGEQQPLDTPCRRGSAVSGDPNYNCPLP